MKRHLLNIFIPKFVKNEYLLLYDNLPTFAPLSHHCEYRNMKYNLQKLIVRTSSLKV